MSLQEQLNVAEGLCEPVCELSLSRSLERLCLLNRVLVGPLGSFHFALRWRIPRIVEAKVFAEGPSMNTSASTILRSRLLHFQNNSLKGLHSCMSTELLTWISNPGTCLSTIWTVSTNTPRDLSSSTLACLFSLMMNTRR
jgi:hypothetical protein